MSRVQVTHMRLVVQTRWYGHVFRNITFKLGKTKKHVLVESEGGQIVDVAPEQVRELVAVRGSVANVAVSQVVGPDKTEMLGEEGPEFVGTVFMLVVDEPFAKAGPGKSDKIMVSLW